MTISYKTNFDMQYNFEFFKKHSILILHIKNVDIDNSKNK